MTTFQSLEVELDKRVHASCAPLFATGRHGELAHTSHTLNATVTFVKHRERYYAVTCHHVLDAFRTEAVRAKKILIPSIHSGKLISQFSNLTHQMRHRWSFHSCRDFADLAIWDDEEAMRDITRSNLSRPDIAIADITSYWEVISKPRTLTPIDLDNWTAPPWEKFDKLFAAYGFPTGHKSQVGTTISAPMPRIAVEMANRPSQDRPIFTLHSTVENPHGWGFSGISGGPVLAIDADAELIHFIGLVFEGTPSEALEPTQPDAIFGPADIFLSCYQLTPSIFDSWLAALKYGVELGGP